MNSNDYILFVDTTTPLTALKGTPESYRPLVCGTANGFNMDIAGVEFRNKDDGGYVYSQSTYVSWGFSFEGQAIGLRNSEKLIKASFNEIANLAKNRVIFWAKMADLDGTIVREGKVRISRYAEDAAFNSQYGFSCDFVGIGEPGLMESIYRSFLAVNNRKEEFLQDGKDNLISTNNGI